MERLGRLPRLLLLALLLPILAPQAAFASPTPDAPPAPAPRWQQTDDYPAFADIPDLVGYVNFHVPQCDECTPDGERPFVKRDPEPPFPNKRRDWIIEVDTFLGTLPVPNLAGGMTKLLIWLGWKIKDVILDLVCLLLIIFQWLADFFATAINVVLAVLNTGWRFFIFAWLTIRQWVVGFWAWLGEARQFFVYVQQMAVLVWAWLVALWDVVVAILGILGSICMLLIDIVLALLGMLAWVMGLTLGVIVDILTALQAETVPQPLNEWTGHGVFYMTRGILDAIHDSPLGWLLLLAYALINLGFFVWLSKFLPSAKEG